MARSFTTQLSANLNTRVFSEPTSENKTDLRRLTGKSLTAAVRLKFLLNMMCFLKVEVKVVIRIVDRTVIQSSLVIAQDAFGFAFTDVEQLSEVGDFADQSFVGVFLFLRVVFNPYRCCYKSTVGVLW